MCVCVCVCVCVCESLEFIAETRILSEMKIKNRGEKIVFMEKKSTTILFLFFFLKKEQSVGVDKFKVQN